MTSWLERGRPAIIEALGAVCDRIDGDLRTGEFCANPRTPAIVAVDIPIDIVCRKEIQERDRHQTHLTDEIERLRSRVATVDRLEQENSSLRAELLHLRRGDRGNNNGNPPSPSKADKADPIPRRSYTAVPDRVPREPLRELSPNKITLPRPRREEPTPASFEKDYSRLCDKYVLLKKEFRQLTDLAQKFRNDRDAWLKYAESLEAKLGRTKKASPDVFDGQQSDSGNSAGSFETDRRRTLGRIADRTRTGPGIVAPSAAISSFRSEPETASLSGPDTLPALDQPPRRAQTVAADLPLVGSSPSAGNATGSSVELPDVTKEVYSNGDIGTNEPSSDEPVVVSERNVRKRRQADIYGESPVVRRIKSEHPSSDPVMLGLNHNFSPHESIDLDHERDVLTTPRKRRALDDEDPSFDAEVEPEGTTLAQDCRFGVGRELNPLHRPAVQGRPYDHPSLTESRRATHTLPSLKSASRKPRGFKSVADEFRLRVGVAELAESEPPLDEPDNQPTEKLISTPALLGRLDMLLSKKNMENDTPLTRPRRQSRHVPPTDGFELDIPTRELPFGKTGERGPIRTPKEAASKAERRPAGVGPTPRPRASGITAAAPLPHEHQLRSRPPSTLRLDDFRINPKFNDGRDYAFSEVVRNKSDRAELPGCTDPECCGKHFRAMAQAELEATGPSAVQRPAGIALLENYLGEQMYKLGGMNRLEKEQLWLEARIRELADKHGKHRHRFTRRQSPPGFWDADFPTTQEMEKEREQGKRRERELVEERWREAMRGGGRWLFRDEYGDEKNSGHPHTPSG